MVGTCSSYYLFCAILIFFSSDSVVLSDAGNETGEHAIELKENEERTEKYPFDKAYYSFKIEPDELIKDARLNPPIDYKTPEGYVLKLEPVTHLCKVSNASIVTKFSAIKTDDKVYIKINEDFTNENLTHLTNDSLIVYKLKVENETNTHSIGGDVTVIIRIVKILTDTALEFEEPSYSIKLSYGRKEKVFRFKVLKTSHKAIETNDEELEFEKHPKSNKHFTRTQYPFNGNYSLEYVPDHLETKLRVSKDGDLEVIGNIEEGFYNFDVIAVDFGPNSTTVLRAKAKVTLFIDNVAVCNSNTSHFIHAYSKHYINEETKLITAVPATEPNSNCRFAISHQYPLGVGAEFFSIDPETGSVHVVSAIDREAYSFEDMEEPSVYLKLKIYCPPLAEPITVQPLNLFDAENIAYDPTTTLLRMVIVDANDNAPVFPDKHVVVGYPVRDVAQEIVPKHVVQVKATDKDSGKNGKIQYSLRGYDAKDYVINPESGTIYCTRLVTDSDSNVTFEVVAKDNDGKSEALESVMNVTVKSLTYSDIIRVNVKFSIAEDYANVESELSEISEVRVISLTDVVINTNANGRWRIERSLVVYAVNKKDGSVVPASELEKKLANNAKILKITMYSTEADDDEMSTGTSMVYAALICLALSMVAMSLLYFGYFKNGRYLSCISSMSTTPLKDDMENMSQSNWITTFNRSNLSTARVRLAGNNGSPVSRTKIIDLTVGAAENSLYEPIPPKAKVSADNAATAILDTKLSVENELIRGEALSPTDDTSFNF